MVKIVIVVVALVCFGLVSARGVENDGRGGGDNHGEHNGGFTHGNGYTVASIVCDNGTLAQPFLAAIQAVTAQLINNGSFADWLQERAQEVAYFQSTTNGDLLASNCTGFFTGLDGARALDRTAKSQRMQYTMTANNLFEGTVFNLLGYTKDDSYRK
ncbi:unnamed protein product [Rotaria sp. Silwood2]|nr:unnamed protein product [Rotaria sp. Silwood2]